MNQLTNEKRIAVVAALVEGNSIRATCRMTGVAKNTVVKLIADLGRACATFQDGALRDLPCKRVQADEIWSFVYAKQKNVARAKAAPAVAGDVWTWTALCADSKLIVSYMVGSRDARAAHIFMNDVAARLRGRIQLTTDGHKPYLDAVEGAFGCDIDYAMLIKVYGSPPDAEVRYSPAECIGCETRIINGAPDRKHINTSYVERQNLSMRMGMRRFTRLTNGFSKKVENHVHMLSLYFLHYNFARVHQTLRVTPAMEAGVADHVWSIAEIVALLDKPIDVSEALTR